MKKPKVTCQHDAQRQGRASSRASSRTSSSKPASRTALALEMVQGGAKIAEAAQAHGIRRQSIYRLMRYRAERDGRLTCEVCGQPLQASPKK
jgi:transposase-like protein